jgi:hypothetical protein
MDSSAQTSGSTEYWRRGCVKDRSGFCQQLCPVDRAAFIDGQGPFIAPGFV